MIPGQAQQFFEAAAAQSGGGDDTFKVERSLRFNSGDTTYLNRTVSSSSNRRTWTWSGWIKRSVIADRQEIFAAGNDGTDFFFDANDKLNFYYYQPGVGYQGWCLTDSIFKDTTAWYHIVLIFDSTQSTTADRVKIYVNNTLQSITYNNNFTQYVEADINLGSTGHYLGRYSASNNELANFYLAETQFIDGQALTPSSFGELDENNNWNPKEFSGSYKPKQLSNWVAQTTGTAFNASTAKANAFDGRTSTAAAATGGGTLTLTPSSAITGITKVRIYAQRDASASGATITLNGTDISSNWNNGDDKQVEITATTLTSLAWTTEPSNQWFAVRQIEIYYDGSYKTLLLGGINSFYLKYSDNSSVAALGTDSSGNSNTWTPNNFSVSSGSGNDSLIDTPTNYTAASGNNGGNYCNWNPLSTRGPTFTEGNLTVTHTGSGASGWRNIASTIAVSSGKWYMEFDTVGSQAGGLMIGIQKVPEDNDQFNPASFSNNFVGMTADSYALNCFSGAKRTNSSDSSYGSGMSLNDKIMMAVDLDNGKIWWGKNNSWFASGDPDSGTNAAFTGLSGTFVFALGISASEKIHSNFGQRPYSYSNNISGFNSVCTQNFATQAVDDGSTAMDVSLWTGNGTSQTISGLNHAPDIAWVKARSFGADPEIYDIVRGAGKRLYTSLTNSESSPASSVNSFTSDGFTVTGGGGVNNNASTYVGWSWETGTSTETNNDGSVTASVRANASAGQSVVSVDSIDSTNTIRTAGHGLNATPQFIISKNRDFADNWYCYHKDVQTNNRQQLRLNTTDATVTSGSDLWAHTSSVIGFNGALYVASGNTDNLIFYCFAPVEGFSAFGSYKGNGLSDGPFVYTGFAPRWVLFKRTDASGDNWTIFDTARDTNPLNKGLEPNTSNSEQTFGNRQIDTKANGFKVTSTGASSNASGATYVYAAFAEHPLKTARAQ